MKFVLLVIVAHVLKNSVCSLLASKGRKGVAPESEKLQIQIFNTPSNNLNNHNEYTTSSPWTQNLAARPNNFSNRLTQGVTKGRQLQTHNKNFKESFSVDEQIQYGSKQTFRRGPTGNYNPLDNAFETNKISAGIPATEDHNESPNSALFGLQVPTTADHNRGYVELDPKVVELIIVYLNNHEANMTEVPDRLPEEETVETLELQKKILLLQIEINHLEKEIEEQTAQGNLQQADELQKTELGLEKEEVDIALSLSSEKDALLRSEIQQLEQKELQLETQPGTDLLLAVVETEIGNAEIEDALVDQKIQALTETQIDYQIGDLKDQRAEAKAQDNNSELGTIDLEIMELNKDKSAVQADHQVLEDLNTDISAVDNNLSALVLTSGHENQIEALLKVKRKLQEAAASLSNASTSTSHSPTNPVLEAAAKLDVYPSTIDTIATETTSMALLIETFEKMFSDLPEAASNMPEFQFDYLDEFIDLYGELKVFVKRYDKINEELRSNEISRYGAVHKYIAGISPTPNGVLKFFNMVNWMKDIRDKATKPDKTFIEMNKTLVDESKPTTADIGKMQTNIQNVEDTHKVMNELVDYLKGEFEKDENKTQALKSDTNMVTEKAHITIANWPKFVEWGEIILTNLLEIQDILQNFKDKKVAFGASMRKLEKYVDLNCTGETNGGANTENNPDNVIA